MKKIPVPVFWREGQLDMKEFYSLSTEEKNDYIKLLLSLDKEMLSELDKHILRFYTITPTVKQVHYFSLED